MITVTVDTVVFAHEHESVLLVQRKFEPFKGQWALPGGILEDIETPKQGAARELFEETGLKVDCLHQLGTWGSPDRDPRGYYLTVGFWAAVDGLPYVNGNDDADRASWVRVANVLPQDLDEEPSVRLAFDHQDIVHRAYLASL